MATVPIKIFQVAPGTTKKMAPGQAVIALQRQTFFRSQRAHREAGAGQFDEIDRFFRNTKQNSDLSAQGFKVAQRQKAIHLVLRKLDGDIPVAFLSGSSVGLTADKNGQFNFRPINQERPQLADLLAIECLWSLGTNKVSH